MPNAALYWTRRYYDGVEHLLWNRDWISGTQPDGTRTPIRLLMERLRRLEAPLHHTMQLFFTLASLSLTARLLKLDIEDFSERAPGTPPACCRW